jgi:hypothetical protein
MPQARRMTSRVPQSERDEIRREVLGEVRAALDAATDFEDFRTGLEESDPSLPGLSIEEIRAMDVETVIANKTAVDAVLSSQRTPPAADGHADSPTGPLTLEAVKKMTPQQVNERWPEVQAVMQRGAA